MAIGTALLVIFGIWLLVAYPRAVFRIVAGLVGVVAVIVAAVYVYYETDRPRREREEAERRVQQETAEARVRREEATLIRNRDTYASADRWMGVAVDTNHCRYFVDRQTMSVQDNGINVWIKVERPTVESGVYLSPNCYDYGGPRQVFFSCVTQYVSGAWSFTPGMISEDVLRWIQKSPWCAKIIEAANAEQERQRKAALARQAERERQEKASAEQQERSRAANAEVQRRLQNLFQNTR